MSLGNLPTFRVYQFLIYKMRCLDSKLSFGPSILQSNFHQYPLGMLRIYCRAPCLGTGLRRRNHCYLVNFQGHRKQKAQSSEKTLRWVMFTLSYPPDINRCLLPPPFILPSAFVLLPGEVQKLSQLEQDGKKEASEEISRLSYLKVNEKVVGIPSYRQA